MWPPDLHSSLASTPWCYLCYQEALSQLRTSCTNWQKLPEDALPFCLNSFVHAIMVAQLYDLQLMAFRDRWNRILIRLERVISKKGLFSRRTHNSFRQALLDGSGGLCLWWTRQSFQSYKTVWRGGWEPPNQKWCTRGWWGEPPNHR